MPGARVEGARVEGARVEVGDVVDVQIGAAAHGGHCVAWHEGQVLFVRHVLPGETARVRVTEVRRRYGRAELVEVLTAAPERVIPPCEYAGRCGGCDWQHTDPATQRRIKAGIVTEQLVRLGGLPADHQALTGLRVEHVDLGGAERPDGTGWRTRVQFAVDPAGRLGLRAHRSHEVVAVDRCLLAADGLDALDLPARTWRGWGRVEAIGSSTGERAVVLEPADLQRVPRLPALGEGVAVSSPTARRGRAHVTEKVPTPAGPVHARVSGSGFWQVHPGAAGTLLTEVLDQLAPRPGQHLLDLYCGVGLFTLGLGPAVGPEGSVVAIESDPQAVRDARRNLHALPQVRIEQGRVERVLQGLREPVSGEVASVDGVVLDPPRSGAGAGVLTDLVRLAPRVISYVACDPAALGRDTRWLHEHGYRLDRLRAFDLFPHTHHVEAVARFVPQVS